MFHGICCRLQKQLYNCCVSQNNAEIEIHDLSMLSNFSICNLKLYARLDLDIEKNETDLTPG